MPLFESIRELRTMFFDPLFSPLFSEGAPSGEFRDESEGAPHSVAHSTRTANTYWRHYRDNPLVRAAVNEIVNALISIPLIADVYDPDSHSWQPLPPDDRMVRLLTSPSQSMAPAQWWQRYYTELTTLGNSYAWKHRTRMDDIDEFWLVDSRHMRPIAGARTMIDGFRFNPAFWIGTGEAAIAEAFLSRPDDKDYATSEIIFTCLTPDPTYPLMGLSPIASALKDIDLDTAITTFTTSLMERGAIHDWALITKTPIDNAESRRIERRWFRRRSGPNNAGGLVVVDGTEADLKQLGMSIGPRDMALMDLRKQVEARILMALNVPPIVVGSVIGLENATYSNYESARMAMHEENTDPFLSRVCSTFEWSLKDEFPEHGGKVVRIRADLSHVWALLDSVDKRDRLALAKMNGGVVSQRETRASIDMPPLAGVDDFYMTPANYQTQAIGVNGSVVAPVNPATANQPVAAPSARLRRTLARSIAGGDRAGALRTLSSYVRSLDLGYGETDSDFLAFDALFRVKASHDTETATEKAARLLDSVSEAAQQSRRRIEA